MNSARMSLSERMNEGEKRYGSFKNAVRLCPDCRKPLVMDTAHSSPLWGNFYKCPDHGIISGPDIVYENSAEPWECLRCNKKFDRSATLRKHLLDSEDYTEPEADRILRIMGAKI